MMEWMRPAFEKMFRRLAFSKNADPALVAGEIEAGRANPMYVLRAMVSGLKTIAPMDITMLTVPTTIILSDSDHMVPTIISKAYYKAAPHHQFHRLANASHMALLETPELVNNVIIKAITQQCSKAKNHCVA